MSCVGVSLSLRTSPGGEGPRWAGGIVQVRSIRNWLDRGEVMSEKSRWMLDYPEELGWSLHLFSLLPARR